MSTANTQLGVAPVATPAENRSASPADGLRLVDVTRSYGGGVRAVDGVSLEVPNGEYVTLLGPSGCGKTTTLRMIGGHDEPSSGDIFLNGQRLNGIPPAKRPLTTVFQHFALFPHRTVLQNVAFGLKVRGMERPQREAEAQKAIEQVGLSAMLSRRPKELSSGQQQRVALARVIVTRPDAILLDEPFGDLDRLLQLKMRVDLRALQRELGVTFIHVTHNQEEALSMSDRIVVMEGGRIRQAGTPEQLARHPADAFVASFMGDNNVIEGEVASSDGGISRLDTEHGQLSVPGRAVAGQRRAFAVRSSAVRVDGDDTADTGDNTLPAHLSLVEYLGDAVKLHLLVGDQPFVAKVHESRLTEMREREGHAVTVSWDARDGQLLEL